MSKELLAALRQRGLLEFGSAITGEEVRAILGIVIPAIGTKSDFDELALAELSAVDYVRNCLLEEGKYLKGVNGNYRVLLPSENARQVEAYMDSANRKLRRARKLNSNTPSDFTSPSDFMSGIRLHMKSSQQPRA